MQLPFFSWKKERVMLFFEWIKRNVIILPSVNQSTDHSYAKVPEHKQSADEPGQSGVQSGPIRAEDKAGGDSLQSRPVASKKRHRQILCSMANR